MSTKNVLYLAAKTNVGRVRELNEDNFITTNKLTDIGWYLPKESFNNSDTGSIMAIADGMGGANAGEIASKVAIDNVKKYFNFLDTKIFDDKNILSILKEAILYAHNAIINYSSDKHETEGMGTTLIIGWIIHEKLYVGWSGDSRCYLFRCNTGLHQVSKDHSFVQSLIDEEKITKEQAFYHPQANVITQSLGDRENGPVPDTAVINLFRDDLILLCSDGLNGMLMDDQIAQILKEKSDNINTCIDLLIDKANEAGGLDNITIIIAKVVDGTSELPAQEVVANNTVLSDIGSKQTDTKKKGRAKIGFFLAGTFLVILFATVAVAWFGFFKQPEKQTQPTVILNDSTLRKAGGKNVKLVPTKKIEKEKDQEVTDGKKQKDDTFIKNLSTKKPANEHQLNELTNTTDSTTDKKGLPDENVEKKSIQKIADPKLPENKKKHKDALTPINDKEKKEPPPVPDSIPAING